MGAEGIGISCVIPEHFHHIFAFDLAVGFLYQRFDPLKTNVGAGSGSCIVGLIHPGAHIVVGMYPNAILRKEGFKGLGVHLKGNGHTVFVGGYQVSYGSGIVAALGISFAQGSGIQHSPHTGTQRDAKAGSIRGEGV